MLKIYQTFSKIVMFNTVFISFLKDFISKAMPNFQNLSEYYVHKILMILWLKLIRGKSFIAQIDTLKFRTDHE